MDGPYLAIDIGGTKLAAGIVDGDGELLVRDRIATPAREVWPALESMLRHVGARNLMWGTDMPFQNRFCTYRQSRRWIETCGLLSDDDLAQVMGLTTARLLGIEPAGAGG